MKQLRDMSEKYQDTCRTFSKYKKIKQHDVFFNVSLLESNRLLGPTLPSG